MTVYRNPVTAAQKAFNKLHIIERSLIERMFGQLKNRFPFLLNKIRTATERVPDLVAACCVLHNVATYLKEEQFEGDVDEEPEEFAGTAMVDGDRGAFRREAIVNSILQIHE